MASPDQMGDKREAWLIDQLTKSEFFHQKLHEYGLLEVARAIEEIRGESLEWDLEDLHISEEAWNKVIHRGIKPVRVFAHPHTLMTVLRAVGYYRQLAMVSLKSMNNIGLRVERFEMGIRPQDKRMARATAQRLNELISHLFEMDEHVDEREFDLWRGMAAGSQAQGSWQNRKGNVVEERVKSAIRHRIRESGKVAGESDDGVTIHLMDHRVVRFGHEPDIAFYDKWGDIQAAVEIKGGIDPAGILERVGAAIKSLSRAKQESPEATTILVMYGVSMTAQARSDLDAHKNDIDYWFTIEGVLNREDIQAQVFDLLTI